MTTSALRRLPAAWLLAAGLASCAHKQTTAEKTQAAADKSQQAFSQAAEEQKAAAEQQKKVDAAHGETVKAQQGLAAAQAKEDQERAKAQQLQTQADQHLAEARAAAQQAQTAAAQSQLQGTQTVSGHVAQATPYRLVLDTGGGKTMAFTMDQRTRVMVGAEQGSVADIQQGADAQVAYDPGGGQPSAVLIRVMPVGPTRSSATKPAQ